MNVIVDGQGRRVPINRPYIDGEELAWKTKLYDPNGYNLNTGLYDRSRPACGNWDDYFFQSERRNPRPPAYSVDSDGFVHYPATNAIGQPAFPRPTAIGPNVGQYTYLARR